MPLQLNKQSNNQQEDLNKVIKQQFSPYQKGVEKALKESGYQQATEAIQQSQDPMAMAQHIEQQTGLTQQPQQDLNQTVTNNVAPQQTQQNNNQLSGMDILKGLLPFLNLPQIVKNSVQGIGQEDLTLIAQRKVNTALMEEQLAGLRGKKTTEKVYRDPITGQEVDETTAKKDMEEGLGIYQVNQRVSTRSGIVEKPLNEVPDLTQEEKKYVNDSRIIGQSLNKLESGFDNLYDKFGKANWQSFQMERIPYILAQDQDVQSLKSELIYMKAAIPFLRGGKQLTPTEAKRVDVMLNPFGKNKETFKKDIQRFEDEFMVGAEINKYGINAGLMRKMIKGNKKKLQKENVGQVTSQQYSQEDLEFTAKKHGISIDEVKKKLGVQ